jgi:uncharacterized protein YkwD
VSTPALLTLLLTVAGCGGGGGDDAPAESAPLPPPVPIPAPAPPPSSAGTRLGCDMPNFEAEMLAAVNAHRRAGASCGARGSFAPAPELRWNAPLAQAAAVHSEDMVARNFFSHTGSNGSTVGDRASAAGYAWRSVGENIAAGQPSIAVVVQGWMDSDGHCANLMEPGYRDLGAACVAGNANTGYRTYWTQDFGTPR